jgi:hypothetical protein
MAAKKKPIKPARQRVAAKKPTSNPAAATSIALDLPRIGAPWPGQGGNFAGIIRGEKGQPDYGLAVPTHPSTTVKGPWGPAEHVKGAESEYDGLANTEAMATAGSKIAKQALAVRIDGHNDFYIPAHREVRLAQTNAPELFGTGWHWTSTQIRAWDDYAWAQDFEDGLQSSNRKNYVYPVRLVRRVPIR